MTTFQITYPEDINKAENAELFLSFCRRFVPDEEWNLVTNQNFRLKAECDSLIIELTVNIDPE